MQEENDEEVHDLRERLCTLRHVAVEIRDTLEDQNQRLGGHDTLMQKSIRKINSSIRKISQTGKHRFNANFYMVLAMLFLVLLFYFLFVAS